MGSLQESVRRQQCFLCPSPSQVHRVQKTPSPSPPTPYPLHEAWVRAWAGWRLLLPEEGGGTLEGFQTVERPPPLFTPLFSSLGPSPLRLAAPSNLPVEQTYLHLKRLAV